MAKSSSLKKYRGKRDFGSTPEPSGDAASGDDLGRRFVVQKHDASRLHYDFRLEMGGALKSWAVPKGPSLDPGEKRLAVETEDHPLDYADFEGIIPEGQYGAGTVMVWDRGSWEPKGNPEKAYRDGRLEFRLAGEKLRGGWVLVKLKGTPREDGKNWLLIKRHDRESRAGRETQIIDERQESVLSGRTMREIEKGTAAEAAIPSKEEIAALTGARKSRQPSHLDPQLASLVRNIPTGEEWIYEIKHDGYRVLAHMEGKKVRLITRGMKDWSARFPEIRKALGELSYARHAILDGEIVALRPDGTSDFQTLQNAIVERRKTRLYYFLFDIPFFHGYDLRAVHLIERKRLLRRILSPLSGAKDSLLRYSDHVEGRGPDILKHACRMSVEGVISKRIDAPYQSGRKGTWTKTKCMGRQEFVVAGYTDPAGSRTGFGALLLAVNDGEGRLVYCGKVGTGFDTRTLARLLKLLKALETTNPSIVNSPWGRRARGIHWVRPKMVVEVEFREWTTEGILRQPSFKGVREDKGPGEVKRELPAASVDAAASHERPPAARVERARTVGGVRISHPHRLVFPKQGLTKAALAEYYERVADWILPHIVNRPLSIVRCPKGHGEDCFYQKHLEEGWPDYVYGVEVQEEGGERETHLTIRDLKGLISLVQFGMLEVHPWGSRVDMIERPDRLVFDLDPGPGVPWKQVVDAAFHMRSVLDGLGLKSFPRTTGGKGLHVLLPIERRYGWDEVKSFCRKVAEHVRDDDSGLYVVNIRKERRKGRILVDYLRNSRGATAVASYSTRARPGATVAVNMSWEELRSVTSPDAYTVKNLPARLEALREDPWADLPGIRQGITKSALTRLTRRR